MVSVSLVSSLGIYWLADDFVATTKRAAQVGALHWWGKFGPILVGTNAATLLVGAVVAGYVVLYASHKVVGPLIRVRRVLEEIGAGRLHREIRLREGDELTETVEAILEMEKKLVSRIEDVRSCAQALSNGEADAAVKLQEAMDRLPQYPRQ
jgi:methyl-accepting chemotaxis protein